MLKDALTYLKHGWSVFPCEENGKQPLVKWQTYITELATEKQVRAWWARWPNANVALACGQISGVVVVDIDPKRGGTQEKTTPTGLVSKTGGGGWHYFYEYPKGVKRVQNQVNDSGELAGMDVRADGGYVILPPSMHASGNPYEWVKTDGELTNPPEWAVKKPAQDTEKKKPDNKEKWISDLIRSGTREGSRNNDVTRLAGYFAGKDIPVDVAESLLQRWMRGQTDPLSLDEVSVSVRSAYRTAKQRDVERNKPTPFNLLNFSKYMVNYGSIEPQWLVPQWLPDATIAFLVSPPGSFKTWITFDLALSVATGKPLFGQFPVAKTGPVILVQQEDFHGQIAERLGTIALSKYNIGPSVVNGFDFEFEPPPEDPPIYLHDERALHFADKHIMSGLYEVVSGLKPRLVIIDPLYSAASLDDYMAKDIENMLALKRMRDEFGTSFMLVHHSKKSADDWDRQNLWGSQFLNAFLETGWHTRRLEDNKSIVVKRHFKAASDPEQVKVVFDISTHGSDHRYKVAVTEATEEEVERAVSKSNKPSLDTYLDVLSEGPATVSELAEKTGKNKSSVSRALKKLESQGEVAKDPDGKYKRLELPDF